MQVWRFLWHDCVDHDKKLPDRRMQCLAKAVHSAGHVRLTILSFAEVDVVRESAHHIQGTMDSLLQELPTALGGMSDFVHACCMRT